MGARLMTAEEVVETFNLPSPRTLRTMRQKGLPAVRLGKAYLFDESDVAQFIANAKVTLCPAQIAVPRSNGSASGAASTSSGTKAGANASVLLARQTASKLKKLSPRSSVNDADTSDQPGRVIQAAFQ